MALKSIGIVGCGAIEGRCFKRFRAAKTSRPCIAQVTRQATPHVIPQVAAVLEAVAQKLKSREELQSGAGLIGREHFPKAQLEPPLAAGLRDQELKLRDKGTAK